MRFFKISGCCCDRYDCYKIKKMSCRSLPRGNQSGLRMTYVFDKANKEAILTELYFKGDKDN